MLSVKMAAILTGPLYVKTQLTRQYQNVQYVCAISQCIQNAGGSVWIISRASIR